MFEKPNLLIEDIQTTSKGQSRFYHVGEEEFVSITSLLGHFTSQSIQEWRNKVGHKKADAISREASSNGTAMHDTLELYLKGEQYEHKIKGIDQENQFHIMKEHLDEHLQDVWWQEIPLYSKRLRVAGRVDCVGIYDNVPTVIDFKTSRKPKKVEWIENYFLQATFYATAIYEMTGYKIEDVSIIISVNKGEQVQIYKEKIKNWIEPLVQKVDQYRKDMEIISAQYI